MIRNIFSAVLVALVLGAAAMLFADGMKHQECYWSTAASTTAQIVQTGKDTSQTISLDLNPQAGREAHKFPAALMLETNYDAQNDTVNVKAHMDLSDDGTNWFAYLTAAEDSSISDADAYRVVHIATTSMPRARYCRIRLVGVMAAGDTVDVTQTVRMWY